MVVLKDTVATAGTPNTHDLGASLDGLGAEHVAITNKHATQLLEVTFSKDGTTYTSEFDIPAASTVVFDNVNVLKMKVDASGNTTAYTVAAWRG